MLTGGVLGDDVYLRQSRMNAFVAPSGIWGQETRLDVSRNDCLTTGEDFSALINQAVVETFFRVPKVNWKTQPKPAGTNGQLSIE